MQTNIIAMIIQAKQLWHIVGSPAAQEFAVLIPFL